MLVTRGKQLGFFAALTMLIGSVVGIGIFFKSHGILKSNDWNGIGTLIAWILGGILSLSAAVSFAELGSIKTSNVSGIPAYAEKLGGKKFGYFTRFNFSFFYFGGLIVALGFFGSEIIIGMFTSLGNVQGGASSVPLYGHAIVAFSISIFFLLMNFLSIRTSGVFQQITTILKWIPLVLVAILGIAMATTNLNSASSPSDSYSSGYNAFTNGHNFTFTGMLAALPAVLFAYDAFLNVLSLSNKIKGGSNSLPKVVIIGMVSVIILYSLIALSAILHGSGMVSGAPFGLPAEAGVGIFDQIFAGKTAETMGKFVIVFLTISTLGVINGVSAAGITTFEQVVETNTIFGSKTLIAKFGNKKATMIIGFLITLFWALIEYIPVIVLNSDAFVDGISNFPTLFMFAVYGIIILLYLKKRNKLTHKKFNNILYKTFAYIAIIGIIFVVGYQFFYGFFINAIINPQEKTSWGLYIDGSGMQLWQSAILLFTTFGIFLLMPYLNWIACKKFENNDVCVSTQ